MNSCQLNILNQLNQQTTNTLRILLSLWLWGCAAGYGWGQTAPTGHLSEGVELIGYCDMQDRPAFKLTIKEHQGRWYLSERP